MIALARNFGKEAALTAGIDAAGGDMVVPIDADLQDPPELIAEFIARWEEGYDVVYGSRADRSSDTAMKRTSAQLFYRIFNRVSDLDIPESAGDFRLMDRQVVEALKQLPERNRFMKGLFAWVGFRQIGVPYARPERAAGVSSMGYVRLWRFALDGITSFSTAPLRVWSVIGFVSAAGRGGVRDRADRPGADRRPGSARLRLADDGRAVRLRDPDDGVRRARRIRRAALSGGEGPADLRGARQGRLRPLMDRATYDRMRTLQEGHWWFEGRRRILSGLIDAPGPAEAGADSGGRLRPRRQPRHAAAASAR